MRQPPLAVAGARQRLLIESTLLMFPRAKILTSNRVGLAVTLVLLAVLVAHARTAFPRQLGIDFYHFWGIPLVQRLAVTSPDPYRAPRAYAAVLNKIADTSSSQKLHEANRYRRLIEPTATPFLYAIFAFLPDDYQRAQALFALIQYLAAGCAIYLLARLREVGRWPAIWIAVLTELTFNPFVQDVKVGNVNSLQLVFLAVLLAVAVRKRYSGNAVVDGLFIGLLGVFVLFKPNTPWIALALAGHYWVVRGSRSFFVGVGVAAMLGTLPLLIGAWYFKHASVWLAWLHYARGIGRGALHYTFDQGNQSLPMLLAGNNGSYGTAGYGLLIAMTLLVCLLLTFTSNGRAGNDLAHRARDAFSNPWFAASIGVLFTFATSPLVWPHYHLLALIPIVWLAGGGGRGHLGTLAAVVCYCALSRPLLNVLLTYECYTALRITMLCSWVPLLPGVFAYGARQTRGSPAAG